MNFNFFDWLRAGVKQSVILGVNDAVDCLGTCHQKDDVQQRLMGFLQDSPAATAPRSAPATGARSSAGRSSRFRPTRSRLLSR